MLLTAVRATGDVPLPQGPSAPDLAPLGDDSWHPIPILPSTGFRRARRIDVALTDEALAVNAMFRDSFVDPDGGHRVVHEHSLAATIDPDTLIVREISAMPRVLRWIECPHAANSVTALVGTPIGDLRAAVDETFRGTATCTHLSSLARALGAPLQRAIDSSLLNM